MERNVPLACMLAYVNQHISSIHKAIYVFTNSLFIKVIPFDTDNKFPLSLTMSRSLALSFISRDPSYLYRSLTRFAIHIVTIGYKTIAHRAFACTNIFVCTCIIIIIIIIDDIMRPFNLTSIFKQC